MDNSHFIPPLPPPWQDLLAESYPQAAFLRLMAFVEREYSEQIVYPAFEQIFSALQYTSPKSARVVILGQDPYHAPGQAHGLAFSVPDGQKIPPSLRNIYRELQDDCGIPPAASGNLQRWAKQGVLLLNAVLTVREGQAASHSRHGWEAFTNALIRELSARNTSGLVFMLWGNYARKKGSLINRQQHLVLEAGHPSPLSVRYFGGCRHFSKTNEWLRNHGLQEIKW